MQNNHVDVIRRMFEYNLWANLKLIEICNELTDDQLEIEVSGVFGNIRPTLVHLIRSEMGYLHRLAGSRLLADDVDWDNLPVGELMAKAKISGRQLISIASKADPATRHDIEVQGEPYHFYNWTVLLQALHHGMEHRAQIKVLLTRLGVEHPDLSAWDYMGSLSSE